jgi:uncharacterized protein YjiS (DUF1127 family)
VGSEGCDGRITLAPANLEGAIIMAHAITLNDYAAPAATSLFARIARAISDYRIFRETLNELEALNDRELADVGITRYNVAAVARSAAYGA